MKLIGVVILTGAHCISPIQQTSLTTVAMKVSCAVVVEKDTATAVVRVSPQSEADNPLVKAVLARLEEPENTPTETAQPQSNSKTFTAAPEPAMTFPPAPVAPTQPKVAVQPKIELPASPPDQGTSLTIVPARETTEGAEIATQPDPSTTEPQASLPEPLPRPAAGVEAPAETPEPQTEVKTLTDTVQAPQSKSTSRAAKGVAKAKDKTRVSAKKQKDQCKGSAKAVWYTNTEGRRKYRCVSGSGTKLY